jgi:hypothetical protein
VDVTEIKHQPLGLVLNNFYVCQNCHIVGKSRGSGNRNKGLILSPFLSRASVLRRGSEKLSMTQNNFIFLIQQKERFLKN